MLKDPYEKEPTLDCCAAGAQHTHIISTGLGWWKHLLAVHVQLVQADM